MQKKKKKKGGSVLSFIVFFLVCAVMGYALGIYLSAIIEDAGFGEVLALVLSFILASFLSTVIHEAGHLVCGLLSGYRFVSFRIGRRVLCRKDGKFVWRRFSIPGTAGQCLMDPPEPTEGKYPFILYNLGGSLCNLLSVIPSVLLLFVLHGKIPVWLAIFLFSFSVYGFISALLNGIPMQSTVANDGRNCLDAARDPEAARAFWVALRINACLAEGKRVKDLPSAYFRMPSDEKLGNTQIANLAVQAVQRLLDEGRYAEADAAISHLLELDVLQPLYKGIVKSQQIYCELLGENRTERIEALRKDKDVTVIMQGSLKDTPDLLGLFYALARLFDRDEQAATAAHGKLAMIAPHYPYAGDVESCRELMARVDEVFEERNCL